MRGGPGYTVAAALVALAVGLLGGRMASGAGPTAVWLGVLVAVAYQVFGFWVLFVWVFPRHRVLAHGVAMVGRFLVVGLMALVWVPLSGLPPAPTLFSLVAVFFVTTLFEPLFLHSESLTRR